MRRKKVGPGGGGEAAVAAASAASVAAAAAAVAADISRTIKYKERKRKKCAGQKAISIPQFSLLLLLLLGTRAF